MAQKPIQSSDIASSDVFTKLIAETKELLAYYDQLDESVGKTAASFQQMAKGFKSNVAGDLQKVVAAEKELTVAIVEQEKRERAKIQTKKTLIGLEEKQAKALEREKKAAADLNNVYKQESKTLNDLRNSYKNLAAQNKANTKEAKTMLKEITRLDTKLKGIDKTVGQSQRNVGNYSSAFGKLGGELKGIGLRFIGLTAIIYGLGRAFSNAFRIFSDFQQANANLAAVLGKSRKDIKALTDDAKRLGASTAFTASQVTELQVAFSKLGFTEEQILNATEATLALAAATGTDLAEAAEVAAATLNGFGLGAEETQRAVDVMAKSFTTTALDMEKFKVAMRAVAPVAKATGNTIERTTAMIGLLANNGVRAETAGTGLRNVFLELEKSGITFEQAMAKINNSSNKAATSMELFGKENAVVGVVLAENVDKLDELETSLNNSGGAAERMANEQLNTLSGSMTKLSSAWEGFILALEDGDGVIARVVRGAIDLTTELVQALTQLTMSASQKESAYLGEIAKSQLDRQMKRQERLVEFSTMHLSNLEKIAKSNEKEAVLAKKMLDLRNKGLNGEQALFVIATQKAMAAKQLKEESEEKIKNDNLELVAAATSTSYLEKEVENYKAINEYQKSIAMTKIQQLSVDELQSIIASDLEESIRKFAQWELERRQQLKGTVDLTEEQTKKDKERKKTAYELATAEENQIQKIDLLNELLQNRINLEKLLKAELEISGGLETVITEKLRDQIDALDDLILKRREARTTESPLNTINETVGDIPGVMSAEEYERKKKKQGGGGLNLIKETKQLADELVDITTWLTDRRIEELDRLAEVEQRKFDESKDRENQIIELRKAGAINTEESLAYEREAQAKALAEQERIAKKKRRLELFNTSLNLMNSYVQQGNANSLGKTISDITALTSFINTLPTFWTGTDTTVGDAVGKQISNGRDGILARVDKSEMILNKGKVDTLAKYGIHSTDGIIQAIESNRLRATPLSAMPMIYDDKKVVERLERQEALLQKIANRPVESTDIEKISNTIKITQTLMQGNKVTTTTKNLRT